MIVAVLRSGEANLTSYSRLAQGVRLPDAS